MKIPKKVTPKKAAANQRNAQKSTGPKSEQGKSSSSQNAIIHGIFGPDTLLPGESERELQQLWSETISSYCPVVSGELRRVEKLVWHEWRGRRHRRAETALLAKHLADHEPASEIAASTHAPKYQQAAADLKKLKEIEEQIKSEGTVREKNQDWLRTLAYHDEVKFLLHAIKIVQSVERAQGTSPNPAMPGAVESQPPTSTTSAVPTTAGGEFTRDLLLGILNSVKQVFQEQQLRHGEHMIRRAEAERNALLVPQEAELNRLMRYEKHLSGLYDRDELALERMQRLRRGEEVPPPPARF